MVLAPENRDHEGLMFISAQAVQCSFAKDKINFDTEGGNESIPWITGSASLKENLLNISLVNTHINEPVEIELDIRGCVSAEVKKHRILTADDIHAHNTFDEPKRLQPASESLNRVVGENLRVTLPISSVNVIACELKTN